MLVTDLSDCLRFGRHLEVLVGTEVKGDRVDVHFRADIESFGFKLVLGLGIFKDLTEWVFSLSCLACRVRISDYLGNC